MFLDICLTELKMILSDIEQLKSINCIEVSD